MMMMMMMMMGGSTGGGGCSDGGGPMAMMIHGHWSFPCATDEWLCPPPPLLTPASGLMNPLGAPPQLARQPPSTPDSLRSPPTPGHARCLHILGSHLHFYYYYYLLLAVEQ